VSRVKTPGAAAHPVRAARAAGRVGAIFLAAGLLEIPWVVLLGRMLPPQQAPAWCALDAAEAVTLIATGLLLRRADPRAWLPASTATGLLLADAWADVSSASSTGALLTALAMALFAELPLAALTASTAFDAYAPDNPLVPHPLRPARCAVRAA